VLTLSRLIASDIGCLVLIYGDNNTGKSALAISLSVTGGKKTLYFRQKREATTENEELQADLDEMQASVDPSVSTVIIDDDDELLHSKTPFTDALPRKWMEDYLTSNRQSLVWITHSIEEIPPWLVGIFSYVLEMKGTRGKSYPWPISVSPSWHPSLEKYSKLNPAYIYGCIDIWERTWHEADGEDRSLARLLDLLSRRFPEASGASTQSVLAPISKAFNTDLWNTDRDLTQLSRDVGQYLKWITRHPEERQPFAILCAGVPGSGKTEFGKFLAKEHGRDLKVYRYSDLASMFVGQTEGKIAEAFKETNAGDFLLMDEVDSMLSSRSHARYGWERTETNELLTQIENFPGVLIACTNLGTILDPAVARRFQKVSFRALRADQLAPAWRLYFPCVDLPESGLEVLAGCATPGDFRLVANGMQFRSESPSTDEVLRLLTFEQKAKERFSDGGGSSKVGFHG